MSQLIRTHAVALIALAGCGRLAFDEGTPADAAPDPSGLVAWYPMESIGNDTMTDATGHGHDGTCSSASGTCPALVPGRLGGGFRFDGVDDQIEVPDAPELQTVLAFTITAWIWFDGGGTSNHCIVNKLLGSGINDSWQMCLNTSGKLFFETADTATGMYDALVAPGMLPIQVWHHVAIVWDGGTKQQWLDGAQLSIGPATVTLDANPIEVGLDIDNGVPNSGFPGVIDEIRIYNRALAPAELVQLAAGT